MKAFEKMVEDPCLIPDNICDQVGNCSACVFLQAKGWREALLWFHKVAEHLSPSDCDLIDKELNDETG